jgi:hypothetical protein
MLIGPIKRITPSNEALMRQHEALYFTPNTSMSPA